MAELKDIVQFSKTLSLLYIDEDREVLQSVTTLLNKAFQKVDDASDATIGIGYARLNAYDMIILDADSSIMSIAQLITNLQSFHPYTQIIVTIKEASSVRMLEIYALGVDAIVKKPIKVALFLDDIQRLLAKQHNTRMFLQSELDKVNETLLYERKRIGRFMLNEKKFADKIKEYEDSIHINRNIYELTRLPSKYALQNALNGTKQALLYLNIDHFDFINTIYGMGKANKLLRECAARLNKFLPKNAELFHITADEFVILLDEPTVDQAMDLAKQIQSLFKQAPVEFDEYSHFIVFSIGIDTGSGKILFVNAKSASKESRFFGGDQIILYNAQSDYIKQQRENLHWIQVLKKAFDEDRILTYYQPVVARDTKKILYYEVLCRLIDDNGKLVDADKFIHSARLVGLITHLTKTVIDKTFKTFAKNNYRFSLNLSMYDLHENYLMQFLKYKCDRYGIEPNRVCLEIVKDVVLNKTEMIDKQILTLKNMGFHIIIDNFGSDAQIYDRIFALGAEYIKIDGKLIKDIESNKAYMIIVKSIIEFAKVGGVQVIAEHVETEQLYDMLATLDIDYAQGYSIAKPSTNISSTLQ